MLARTTKQRKELPSKVTPHDRYMARIVLVDRVFELLQRMVKWGAIAFVFWMVRWCIHDLAAAGTTSLIIKGVLEGHTDKYFYWLAILLTGGYGYYQKKARQQAIKNIYPTRKMLEQALDSARTSSGLTLDGETPGD